MSQGTLVMIICTFLSDWLLVSWPIKDYSKDPRASGIEEHVQSRLQMGNGRCDSAVRRWGRPGFQVLMPRSKAWEVWLTWRTHKRDLCAHVVTGWPTPRDHGAIATREHVIHGRSILGFQHPGDGRVFISVEFTMVLHVRLLWPFPKVM